MSNPNEIEHVNKILNDYYELWNNDPVLSKNKDETNTGIEIIFCHYGQCKIGKNLPSWGQKLNII